MTTDRKLTVKQQLFINHYLGDAKYNATEAARLAGYKIPNCDGPDNLRKPAIAAVIREMVAQTAMTAEECLSRLGTIGKFDVSNYLVAGERIIRHPKTGLEVDREQCWVVDVEAIRRDGFGYVIKSVRCVDGITEVVFHDAHAGLRDIGRHHKLFVDKVEADVTSAGKALGALNDLSDDELDRRIAELACRKAAEAVQDKP